MRHCATNPFHYPSQPRSSQLPDSCWFSSSNHINETTTAAATRQPVALPAPAEENAKEHTDLWYTHTHKYIHTYTHLAADSRFGIPMPLTALATIVHWHEGRAHCFAALATAAGERHNSGRHNSFVWASTRVESVHIDYTHMLHQMRLAFDSAHTYVNGCVRLAATIAGCLAAAHLLNSTPAVECAGRKNGLGTSGRLIVTGNYISGAICWMFFSLRGPHIGILRK